ncbi:zona pellucida-like domain-containing protein 1 isoform X1 [Acipenser ruthenus]|uniref:zona pellucida-like domain-containing protein 1 isoform X1 n=1 Tax=Acipenser ruthenus TaxID=7906 RepID=UPI002740F751|nr:zona pellucida-like domain-containing protein 1 isoform X1 [Acipenser ruthenus]
MIHYFLVHSYNGTSTLNTTITTNTTTNNNKNSVVLLPVCLPVSLNPANSDISVMCGTQILELSILLCPIYFAGYNESLMVLNGQFRTLACHGTPDWSVDPPILKYNFSISEWEHTTCAHAMRIDQEVGSGVFSDYSSVQFANISGAINSFDLSTGTITYQQELMYIYSCRYPLQYLVNNTEMGVSGVSLVVKDNNGSFISTLSMQLFEDRRYSTHLVIPSTGLQLKKRIFVEVKATNLTDRFNVLLDRCYATTSPFPVSSLFYNLFVGCTRDGQTVIISNGQEQLARFSFEAFRFVEHKNLPVSTFYLHCATRLCEKSACRDISQNCTLSSRRRREAQSGQSGTVSEAETVSSGPIVTKVESVVPSTEHLKESTSRTTLAGVGVAIGVLGVACVSLLLFMVFRNPQSRQKTKLEDE